MEPSERHIQRLDEVDELRWWVGRVFRGDPEAGRQWLTTHQPGFGGKAPVHLVVRGDGARKSYVVPETKVPSRE